MQEWMTHARIARKSPQVVKNANAAASTSSCVMTSMLPPIGRRPRLARRLVLQREFGVTPGFPARPSLVEWPRFGVIACSSFDRFHEVTL